MINLIQTLAVSESKVTTSIEVAKRGAIRAPLRVPGAYVMNLVKEALLAILVATWAVGLVSQIGSWTMTALYIAISLVMITVTFGNRLIFRFVPRRNRRR